MMSTKQTAGTETNHSLSSRDTSRHPHIHS